MGTSHPSDCVAEALFGKTRRAILALFFTHCDEAFYLREAVRRVDVGSGAVQRELKRLTGAGILERTLRGNQVYYGVNRRCPVFAELQGLVIKTAGVADVLRDALAGLPGRVQMAFVFGSMAKGRATSASDVDLVLIGEPGFAQVVAALGPAQERLGREVNPIVYSPEEFHRKWAEGNHFLRSVVSSPKVYLVGDDNELGRLAQRGVGNGAPEQPTRNRRPSRRRGP
jgi:predicted nucleotidyltransferase